MGEGRGKRPFGPEGEIAFQAYLDFSDGANVDLTRAFENLSDEELAAIDEHMRRIRKAVFVHVEFSRKPAKIQKDLNIEETYKGFSGEEVQYMFDKADAILKRERHF